MCGGHINYMQIKCCPRWLIGDNYVVQVGQLRRSTNYFSIIVFVQNKILQCTHNISSVHTLKY